VCACRPNYRLIQPGAEGDVIIKLGKASEASNESILDGILSHLFVTDEANGQTKGALLVSEHELFVGSLISTQTAADDFLIVGHM
jgi:hypothetical protein